MKQSSAIFGLRYLEESELKLTDVVGCHSIFGGADPTTAESVTFKLDGCGSDTDGELEIA
jgi:hypothetical protein